MFDSLRVRWPCWRNSLTWRVLKNAGWASAASPVTMVLGVVQTGLLARMVGPEGVGAVALFCAVCALFSSLFKFTSAEAAIVFVTKALAEGGHDRADYLIRYFYLLDFATSLLAFSGVALSARFLPGVLNLAPGQEWLQAMFGLTLVFQSTYWTSHALLRVADRFAWTFCQAVAHSVIKTILVALLFVSGAGLREVVFLLVAVSLLDGLSLNGLAWLALRRQGLSRTRQPLVWWRVPGEVWRFQVLGYGRQIVKSLNRYADTLMIGYIGNPLQVGYYRSGKQITDVIQNPAQALIVSLFPEYCQLYFAGDMPRLRRLVGRFAGLFLLLGLLASLVLWFGAEWIIRIVLGDAFLPAQDVVRILMVSAIVLIVMTPVYSLPAAVGRAGPALWSVMAALGVQAVFIFWLVPQQGALGAAWANVAGMIAWSACIIPSIFSVLGYRIGQQAREACNKNPAE